MLQQLLRRATVPKTKRKQVLTSIGPDCRDQEKRLADLHTAVNICFGFVADVSYSQLSGKTGLSSSTLRRLWRNEFGLRVQWRTISSLACVAGLSIEFTEQKQLKIKIKEAA